MEKINVQLIIVAYTSGICLEECLMKEKLRRFLQGRYGADQLNTCLLVLYIVVSIAQMMASRDSSLWMGLLIVDVFIFAILIYRMFSRDYASRSQENRQFLALMAPFKRFYKLQKMRLQDCQNCYYRCPKCKQLVRVPKGRGKVEITCPKCQYHFEKRS